MLRTIDWMIIQILCRSTTSFELSRGCGIDIYSIRAKECMHVRVVLAWMNNRIDVLEHESCHGDDRVGIGHANGTENECGGEKLSHLGQEMNQLLLVGKEGMHKASKTEFKERTERESWFLKTCSTKPFYPPISNGPRIQMININGHETIETRILSHITIAMPLEDRYESDMTVIFRFWRNEPKNGAEIALFQLNCRDEPSVLLFPLYWAKEKKGDKKWSKNATLILLDRNFFERPSTNPATAFKNCCDRDSERRASDYHNLGDLCCSRSSPPWSRRRWLFMRRKTPFRAE